jgi:WD40-like Beta Propeller Repeat
VTSPSNASPSRSRAIPIASHVFQREAEVLASLNHPHIAAIYDLQEIGGARFLVLELVEGEMLAGRAAFGGDTITDILGSVVKSEPDWAMLPKDTPPHIRRLLTRCLQKDKKRRLHHIADARLDLDETPFAAEADAQSRPSRTPWMVAAAATILAIAGGVALYIRGNAREPAEQRVEINVPPALRLAMGSFALSPDGSKLPLSHRLIEPPSSGYGRSIRPRCNRTLYTSTEIIAPDDWSSNGYLLFQKGLVFKRDLFALRVSSDAKPEGDPIPIAVDPNFDERDAKFSSDGKWIAYQSNETGRFEIYVVPFPSLDNKIPITSNGGLQVRWRRDNRELVYLALDGSLMSVPMTPAPDGKTIQAGAPLRLFQTSVLTLEPSVDINGQSYEMSPKGDRFFMLTGGEEALSIPITLVLNWKPTIP